MLFKEWLVVSENHDPARAQTYHHAGAPYFARTDYKPEPNDYGPTQYGGVSLSSLTATRDHRKHVTNLFGVKSYKELEGKPFGLKSGAQGYIDKPKETTMLTKIQRPDRWLSQQMNYRVAMSNGIFPLSHSLAMS